MDSFGTFKINTCIPIKKFFFSFGNVQRRKSDQKNITATRKETEERRVESVDPIFKVRDLARSSSDIQGLEMALFLFLATRERGDSKPLPSLLPLYVLSNQPLFFFPFLEAEAATPSPSPFFRQREWDARDPQKTIAGSTAQWGEKKERGKSERKKKCMGRRLPTTNLRRL